jgi:hypothetical protein
VKEGIGVKPEIAEWGLVRMAKPLCTQTIFFIYEGRQGMNGCRTNRCGSVTL